jgi:hypothetical protein
VDCKAGVVVAPAAVESQLIEIEQQLKAVAIV